MLYSYMMIALALMIPISAFFAFKVGYKTGRAIAEGKEIPPIAEELRRSAKKPEPITQEQKRTRQILANIEHYNGSSKGQVKVDG